MARTLTPAQQAKSEARRERFKALAGQIAAMTDAARAELAMSLPVTTIEGRTLSGNNCCLVAIQCPTATLVGGFRQWLDAGRCVRKGEHGLMIWVPTMKRGGESDGVVQPDEKRFIMGTVFDVSQTDVVSAESEA